MRIAQITLVASLFVASVAHAEADTGNLKGRFGLGFQVGQPFAIVGKYWLSQDAALQGYAGTFDGDAGILGLDWVQTIGRVRPSGAPIFFGFHIGVGGALGLGDHACFDHWGHHYGCDDDDTIALGVRVPVAANMYFDKVPIEVFLELAPLFQIVPDFHGDLSLGLGGRYYF